MEFSWTLISWLAPPAIGAIIGYFTNYLAIRMLFRPLRAKRLGPIAIPLTPGVIPRNRYELADSVGHLVASQLLSPEIVQEQLDDPAFRRSLNAWIREQSPSLLRRSPINQLVGQLTDWSMVLLSRKTPEILQVVDVGQMVTERINSFESEQVERMILSVTGKHLKWINWFGAILGAVIGSLQLLIRAFS